MHVHTVRTVRAHCMHVHRLHLQVVLWHTRERRKLSRDESPSKAELCRFLQAHARYTLTQAHHGQAKRVHTTHVLRRLICKPDAMHLRAPACTCMCTFV